MRTALVIMVGIGFTLGVVFGLLLQLPIDNTLSADSTQQGNQLPFNLSAFRSRRSLSQSEEKLPQEQQNLRSLSKHVKDNINRTLSFPDSTSYAEYIVLENQIPAIAKSNLSPEKDVKNNVYGLIKALKHSADISKEKTFENRTASFIQAKTFEVKSQNKDVQNVNSVTQSDFENESSSQYNNVQLVNNSVVRHFQNSTNASTNIHSMKYYEQNVLHEDSAFMSNIVNAVFWSPRLEKSCPNPFPSHESDSWRRRAEMLDVVKIEEGCGRMQNRLVTFRDASKACARYRLNTDQIQGDIFSYYLARVLNVSNIPPTVLAKVDALSSKWRTVHIQLSLAQWADSKLVVLTQYIDGLFPAHIPPEFREEGKRLDPTLTSLGSKSASELCELVQWSDLIVFDYLTANLDRVINNMFNRQWNDQMMSNPAHNLEQQVDGSLVFLDNESGLFHGYRLLDKYSTFHRTLLQALCVFRPSTAETIKRLHKSSSIGHELHVLFASNEVLHKYLPVIPEKNLKILQQRLADVYEQIIYCEKLFNR